jgi:tight adherence protein B
VTLLLAGTLMLAVILLLRPPGGVADRFRRAAGPAAQRWGGVGRGTAGHAGSRRSGIGTGLWILWGKAHRADKDREQLSLTLVVQQLAALLKGGRTPSRLWDELWLVHQGHPGTGPRRSEGAGEQPEPAQRPQIQGTGQVLAPAQKPGGARKRPGLSAGSLTVLGAVRAAAFRGLPVSQAIRRSAPAAFPRAAGREPRIWLELAACFDIAEASGCPLAEVLARFAAQLEVEDDADAARETALAGPKATVSLLTWLPVMGLGLGMALGVDPLAMLFGTPLGMAALAAGVALTIAGRIWSARLVHAAAGAAP